MIYLREGGIILALASKIAFMSMVEQIQKTDRLGTHQMEQKTL